MRLRGILLAGGALAGLALAGALTLPMLGGWAARQVETRLAQETGRTWRVGNADVQFRPIPRLVLRDVSVGGKAEPDATAATIREIRVSDPFSLWLGSGKSGHAIAEGLSVRAPLAGSAKAPKEGPAAPSTPAGFGGSIKAVIRGGDAELVEDGRALAAKADAVEIDFDRTGRSDPTAIRASLEMPAYLATLSLDLPRGGGSETTAPADLTLEPRGVNGHRIAAKARASLRSTALTLDSVTGTIDKEPFTGSFEFAWSGRPRFALDLRLDALTVIDEANAPAVDGKPADGLVVAVKPDLIPDSRWFSGFDGKGTIGVARLTLGGVRFEKVEFTSAVKESGLDAALVSASGYGGAMRGRYVLAPDSESGGSRHQLSLSLNKVRVLPLLTDIANARGVDGIGSLRVDLQAEGTEVDAVRRSVAGSADVSVTEGRINGLDLAGSIAGGLIPADVVRRGNALGTRLDQLSSSFTLNQGQAVTNDLLIRTGLMEAKGIGSVDLIDRTLDIRLKPQILASNGRPSSGKLDVPITISGPWDRPSVSADPSALLDNPGAAIQSLKDIGANVLGGHGGQGGGGQGGGSQGSGGDDGLGGLGGLLDSFIPRGRGPRR